MPYISTYDLNGNLLFQEEIKIPIQAYKQQKIDGLRGSCSFYLNQAGLDTATQQNAALAPSGFVDSEGDVLFGDGTFKQTLLPAGGSYGSDYVGWPVLGGQGAFNWSQLNVSANLLLKGKMIYYAGTYNRLACYVNTGSSGKTLRQGFMK